MYSDQPVADTDCRGSGAASGNLSSATGSLHGSENQAGSSYDYDSGYDSDDGSLRDFEAGLEEGFKDGLKAGNRGVMGGMVAAAIAIGILIVVFLVIFVLILLVDVFIINPFEVGCRRFFIRNLNEPAQIGNIGYGFDNNYRNVAKTMFFRDLFTVLWSLLFVIPGIVKAYEYMMIPYLLADNPQMTKEQAFAESKRMMQGQKWKAFVLDLSFIGWYILSGLTLGILAIFYVSPYVNATHAALYEVTVLCKPGWFKRIYTAGGSGEFTFPAGECMNYTILIADDEPEIRTLLRLYLENENYQIIEAENGKQALELLKKEHVDLCLLDIMMPEMDGYHVLQELRKTSNIPVMILSAKDADSEKILGLNLGADDYLAKPFNPLEAVARVNSNIRRFYALGTAELSSGILTVRDLELDPEGCVLKKMENRLN